MNKASSAASSSTVVLPSEVPKKPDQSNGLKFKEPVRWLLGEQIIADLKLLVLHAIFGSKLDSRDWMTPDLIRFLVPEQPPEQQPSAPATAPEKVPPVQAVPPVQTLEDKLQALRNSLRLIELPPALEQCGVDPEKEFWFDYLADTGDGQSATYSVAYACMSHLSLNSTEIGAEVKPEKSADCEAIIRGGGKFLPRGRFLFIGGDTSYNVAEYPTLVERFQSPFCWAYKDLVEGGYFSTEEAKYPRPLFGIPGNHDYYDALDGFNRQFRQPITEKLGTISDYRKLLHIPAFKRFQEASYVALNLPFGWWLWGLDTESNELDFRQKEFFRSLPNPQKLIVATPSPTTYFGRHARLGDKLTEIFKTIELEIPFLSEKEKEQLPEKLRRIPHGKCRLDLSGDIHHYARYWGTPAQDSLPWGKEHVASNPEAPHEENYASVMAGGGGASFHPSDTDIGELEDQVLYPRHAESRAAVFTHLFNPVSIWRAGKVWLMGIIIACVTCFALTVPQSGWDALNTFPLWELLNVAEPTQVMPTARSASEQIKLQQTPPAAPLHAMFFGPWNPQALISKSSETNVTADAPSNVKKCGVDAPLYFWGRCKAPHPLDYSLGVFLVSLSIITILLGAQRAGEILTDGHARRVAAVREADSGKDDDRNKTQENEEAKEKEAQRRVAWRTSVEVGISAGVTLLTLGLGMVLIIPFLPYITPFGNSLVVFLTLMVGIGAVSIALRYDDWRFKLISQKKVHTSHDPSYLLWLLAIGSVGAGFWFFGRNNPAAYLASDILLCIFVLLITVGFTLVAVSKGQELHGSDKPLFSFLFTPKGLLFALLGLWHASLQLLVPLFLILRGNILTLIYAAFVIGLFTWIGSKQARVEKREKKLNNRGTLLILWFIFGALMLLWPLTLETANRLIAETGWLSWLSPFTRIRLFHADGNYVDVLIMLLAAGLIGAVTCCVWVGWYLAVMLSFNAHNSEAGGAARLEGFNQFIRIKLTPDKLTAYVIGFNDARQDGKDLDLRLIDSFTIKAREAQGGS